MDNSIVNFNGLDIVERKTAAKKPASSSKKKKTSTAKKKTSASIRLSAAEKKLVQNYRKSNLIEKKLLDFAAEKFAEGIDAASVVNLLRSNL
ncbi:MAG: hypothetical protein IJ201_11535 [Solobacterium sp.]|jgi:hypothetical protein|nr:hypothetical protein [Solobacterium sp.]